MRWTAILTSAVLVFGAAAVVTLGHAQESDEADERREYVSTADHTELIRDELAAFPGQEVHIYHSFFPAGWVGKWHYHTGDVFVHVVEGEFVVDLEEGERLTFGPGEVYHEAVDTVMQARNPSTTTETEAYIFQVGDLGEPLMMLAE